MNNKQLKQVDVQNLINELGLDLTLFKTAKKWEIDGNKFDNLKQVVSYVHSENKRINPVNKILPEVKQGGNSIKLDTTKLIAFSYEVQTPQPTKIKSKEFTKRLAEVTGVESFDAVTDMLRDENNKRYDELKQVVTLRNEFNSFVDQYALKFSIGGCRVLSVHHRDKLVNKINELNDKLTKTSNAIIAKLDDWKQTAIDKGNYIEGKFPTADYFSSYHIKYFFAQLDESFDFNEEVAKNVVERVGDKINTCLDNITRYLSGDTNRCKETSVSNLRDTVKILKESGIVSDESFNKFIDELDKVSNEINLPAIREAKKKVDGGVVTSTRKNGINVSVDDIKNAQKYIDETLDPLKKLSEQFEGTV